MPAVAKKAIMITRRLSQSDRRWPSRIAAAAIRGGSVADGVDRLAPDAGPSRPEPTAQPDGNRRSKSTPLGIARARPALAGSRRRCCRNQAQAGMFIPRSAAAIK